MAAATLAAGCVEEETDTGDESTIAVEDWYITGGFMAPAEVSDLHIAWLHELLSAAVETDEYQSRLDTIPGLEIDVLSVEETNRFAREGYEFTEPIIREAGLHWEDQ